MTSLPVVTVAPAGPSHYRYEVDGQVHTARSKRVYTHASVYRRTHVSEWQASKGMAVGDLGVWLHARADLAAKGSPDANHPQSGWARVGSATIREA